MPAHARRLLLLLAALTALVMFSVSSALAAAGAQNSVRAFSQPGQARTGLTALESSCSRPGFTASAVGIVSGFCVAAEEGPSLASRIWSRLADETGSIGGYSPTRIGALARRYGVSRDVIGDAIHALKQDLSGGTGVRNPDLYVDSSGEAYPIGPGGTLGDSIGNINDYLP